MEVRELAVHTWQAGRPDLSVAAARAVVSVDLSGALLSDVVLASAGDSWNARASGGRIDLRSHVLELGPDVRARGRGNELARADHLNPVAFGAASAGVGSAPAGTGGAPAAPGPPGGKGLSAPAAPGLPGGKGSSTPAAPGLPGGKGSSTPAVGGGPGVSHELPVEIAADRFLGRSRDGVGHFEGHVVVTRGEMRLTCEQLEVTYNRDQQRIERMVARGSVLMIAGARQFSGARILFDQRAGRVTLEGDPVLRDGADEMRGERIIWDLESDQVDCQRCRVRWTHSSMPARRRP